MILFYGEGRLGNQVFQFQALRNFARPREWLLSAGLEQLQSVFETPGSMLTVLTRLAVVKRIFKFLIVPLLLRPLACNLRLINYATDPEIAGGAHAGTSGELQLRRGLLRRFTFVDGGHYQSSRHWPSVFPCDSLSTQAALMRDARAYLERVCKGRQAFFVHVRRGDYLQHVDYGQSELSLPMEYYRHALRELTSRFPAAHLVFVTDDAAWVKEAFRDVKDKSVTDLEARMDFAIMTACAGGVLSNSTFSLAAALLLQQPALVIAPRYWLGFRVHRWLPPHIQYQHPSLMYLQVQS